MIVVTARLTPGCLLPCQGRVHSIFERTANVMMDSGLLLTLAADGLPRLPDSICLPMQELARLTIGQPVSLTKEALHIGNAQFFLAHDAQWNGYLAKQTGTANAETLVRLTQLHPGGLNLLPVRRMQQSITDLCTADAVRWIGLGPGLTPSYDDALVGVMAVCRAEGITPPFELTDLSVTTDVSARYLRLAREGYFGEYVLDVIHALYGRGDLTEAVERLAGIGATSGCDMLLGMAQAWIHLIKPHKEEQHGKL